MLQQVRQSHALQAVAFIHCDPGCQVFATEILRGIHRAEALTDEVDSANSKLQKVYKLEIQLKQREHERDEVGILSPYD